MIDLLKAEEEFKKYVNNYDLKNPHIERKVIHSYKVVELADIIAKSLNLNDEDIELAKLIALLHDIGRFEQLKIYGTYKDRFSIDHGDFGVKILFDDGLIRNFIDDDKYDSIIYKAIKNHNKYGIEEGCNDKELLHCKIIRDADKTDIFRNHADDIIKKENILFNYDEIKKQYIGEEVRTAFKEHRLINSNKLESELDWFFKDVAFIFDFNFPKGVEIVKNKGYIDVMLSAAEDENISEELKFIRSSLNKYFNKMLGEKK